MVVVFFLFYLGREEGGMGVRRGSEGGVGQ